MARAKRTKDRPFPWRCGSCDEKEVYRTPSAYKTTIKYEGRPYDVELPDLELPKCRKCGEVVFDNHAGHQINRVLRQQLGLLQPDQIRAGRNELGLSQRDFAAHLGVAEESVSRWETGALIQSRVVDRQIRLFFEFPSVREALIELQQGVSFGEVVKIATPTLPSTASVLDLKESLLAALEDSFKGQLEECRSAIHETSRELWKKRFPTKSREWRESWPDRSSLWDATTKYALVAAPEEIRWVTQMFGSLTKHPVSGGQRRWFAVYAGPRSPVADSISQCLSRLTQDLEEVPETQAAPLLDNFTQILDMFRERQAPASGLLNLNSGEK